MAVAEAPLQLPPQNHSSEETLDSAPPLPLALPVKEEEQRPVAPQKSESKETELDEMCSLQ